MQKQGLTTTKIAAFVTKQQNAKINSYRKVRTPIARCDASVGLVALSSVAAFWFYVDSEMKFLKSLCITKCLTLTKSAQTLSWDVEVRIERFNYGGLNFIFLDFKSRSGRAEFA